jgi:hypothetical protein
MALRDDRHTKLYEAVFDILRKHGHRPGLHLVRHPVDGHRRAWLSAAGFGALGEDIEEAARLYLRAGQALASDEWLREELRGLSRRVGLPA